MCVLSLDQYETDVFNSIKTKSFYSINENSFLFINHKNKKLKEVFINISFFIIGILIYNLKIK